MTAVARLSSRFAFYALRSSCPAPILRRMELVVTLLVVGAILLLLETILPGMIAGIIGGCCLIAGVILGYMEFGAQTGTWILCLSVAGVIGGFCVWVRVFPTSRYGRAFISKGVTGEIRTERPELLHQTGTAFTQLRPSGTALINGQRVDVVTEGSLIEKGTRIKVVGTEGLRVVVRAITESSTQLPETKTTHS
jgi:membrane-bound serine protease (ClpP class)